MKVLFFLFAHAPLFRGEWSFEDELAARSRRRF